MKQDEKDGQAVKDAERLGRLTDPAADTEGGDTAEGGPETTGVIIHGNDPGEDPPQDDEEGDG
jgi:hypothetical protein